MNVVAADPRDQSGHVLDTFKLLGVNPRFTRVSNVIYSPCSRYFHLHFLTYYLSLWGVSRKTGGIVNVVKSQL